LRWIDKKSMPIVAIAPKDALLEKAPLQSAGSCERRGGELHVMADQTPGSPTVTACT